MLPKTILKHYNVEAGDVQTLAGGDINDVYLLRIQSTASIVIKVNDANRFPGMFEKEAEGLRLLASTASFRIPAVISVLKIDGKQILELEFIESGDSDVDFPMEFGLSLAKLHNHSSSTFGGVSDNYIGSLNQSNTSYDSWTSFFVNERIIPLIKLSVDGGIIGSTERKQVESFFRFVDELWPKETPALIHGDLWSGNYMVSKTGRPVLIDPAVYYGHREMDLGMMKLFGGFDHRIFEVYHQAFPLEKGWEKRVPYNQLYPLLVHLCLFGRGYWSSIQNIVRDFS